MMAEQCFIQNEKKISDHGKVKLVLHSKQKNGCLVLVHVWSRALRNFNLSQLICKIDLKNIELLKVKLFMFDKFIKVS